MLWERDRLRTAAPAPSPNKTHVERSVQSTIELIRSDPTTRIVSPTPVAMSPSATVDA